MRPSWELKPGIRIVDVGCGTGDFTRYLAELVAGKCTIIGVDNWAASLRAAEKQTAKGGHQDKISYREGDAYKIPVKDGWADLTCCRTLLMHLTEPMKAVREMIQITRKGGMVAAMDPGSVRSLYVPDDEKLTRDALRLGEACIAGVRKLERKESAIGERLPTPLPQGRTARDYGRDPSRCLSNH